MRRILHRTVRTKRHQFDEDNWADYKERFNVGDRALISQAMVTGEITASGKDGESAVHLGQLALGAQVTQTLIQAIVAWGGPAFCSIDHEDPNAPAHTLDNGVCRTLPVEPQFIAVMDEDAADELLAVINAKNPKADANSPNP